MPTVSTGIYGDANFLNLKAIDLSDVRPEVANLMSANEGYVAAFATVRDQVVFTNKRVFVINVKGITGAKVAYFSYPYSKVLYYGIETAGVLDIDSELVLAFSNGAVARFDFKSNVDIRQICSFISQYALG